MKKSETGTDLTQLRKRCAALAVSDTERLRVGEARRFEGRPAPAEPGTLALALGDLTIVVAEADIRAARDGDRAAFTIGADANAIFRLERTMRAGDLAPAPCECKSADTPIAGARRLPDLTIDLETGSAIDCTTALVCFGTGAARVCVEIFYNCRFTPPSRRSAIDVNTGIDADTGLNALRVAGATGRQTDVERLRSGETLWLTGAAAPAERGTVAIAQGDLRMIMAEADVRGIHRDGDRYSVGIGADAQLIFRIERTARVGGLPDAAAPCAACGDGAARQAARAKGDIILEVTVCKVLTLCFTVLGRTYCIRIPYDCEGPFVLA